MKIASDPIVRSTGVDRKPLGDILVARFGTLLAFEILIGA
jgi:hypothetical protein